MTGLDYVLLGLVGLSALLGFWRGLLSEIIALGAWVLAFMAARAFLPEVQPLLASGALVQVLPEYRQSANVWAVYPTRLAHSARLRACVEFLEQYLAALPVFGHDS